MTTMTKKQEKQNQRQQSISALLAHFSSGDLTVYTALKHVSSSGMMRHIACYIVRDNKIVDITWHVSRILDLKRANNGGVKVSGCGMDMGFHVVYELSCALFCPSKYEHDSAYKLNQKWI